MQVNYVEMETFVSTSKITLFHRSDAVGMFRCKLARYIVCCTVQRNRRPWGVGSHTHKPTHLTPARNRRQCLTNVFYSSAWILTH